MANGTNTANQGLPAIPAIDELYRQLSNKWFNETTSKNDEINLLWQLAFNDYAYNLYVGGTLVSIIFLALKFFLYFAVPNDLRRLPDKLVHQLSWTLLMSQIVLLIAIVVTSLPSLYNANILFGLSVVLHFSVLSAFFFLNALVFSLFTSSSSTPGEGQSSQQKYCLYAYGIPACIVLAAVILQWTLPESSTFRPNYVSPLFCWLRNFEGRMVFLLVPLGILLVASILLFLLTALKSTFRPCCNQRNLHQPKTYDEYMNQTRGEQDGCCCRFILYFLLNALVSFTWIFRLLEVNEYRLLVFFMLSILQGPFVFLAFTPFRKLCCRPTAKDDLYALIPKTTKF